jgi:hypothetical protein
VIGKISSLLLDSNFIKFVGPSVILVVIVKLSGSFANGNYIIFFLLKSKYTSVG